MGQDGGPFWGAGHGAASAEHQSLGPSNSGSTSAEGPGTGIDGVTATSARLLSGPRVCVPRGPGFPVLSGAPCALSSGPIADETRGTETPDATAQSPPTSAVASTETTESHTASGQSAGLPEAHGPQPPTETAPKPSATEAAQPEAADGAASADGPSATPDDPLAAAPAQTETQVPVEAPVDLEGHSGAAPNAPEEEEARPSDRVAGHGAPPERPERPAGAAVTREGLAAEEGGRRPEADAPALPPQTSAAPDAAPEPAAPDAPAPAGQGPPEGDAPGGAGAAGAKAPPGSRRKRARPPAKRDGARKKQKPQGVAAAPPGPDAPEEVWPVGVRPVRRARARVGRGPWMGVGVDGRDTNGRWRATERPWEGN